MTETFKNLFRGRVKTTGFRQGARFWRRGQTPPTALFSPSRHTDRTARWRKYALTPSAGTPRNAPPFVRLTLGFCLVDGDFRAPFEDFGGRVFNLPRCQVFNDARADLSAIKIGVPLKNDGGFIFDQKNIRRRSIGKNRGTLSIAYDGVVIDFAVSKSDLLDEPRAIKDGVVKDVPELPKSHAGARNRADEKSRTKRPG